MAQEAGPLSRERILAATLSLIDREGLEELSMDRLGAALGVSGMALYKHFPGKRALLDALVQGLLGSLPPAPGGDDWHESLREFYRSLWALYRAHPNVLPLLSARPLTSPAIRACTQANLELLGAAGVEAQAARGVLATLTALTLGFAGLAGGGYLGGGAGTDGAAIGDEDFEAGLAIVLEGVAAQLG